MSLGAVVRAGLAAGPLRLGLRRPLGEGGGLALAVPLCLFEEAGQALGLGFELGGAAPQVGDEAVAFAAAPAGRALHTRIVAEGFASAGSASLQEGYREQRGAKQIRFALLGSPTSDMVILSSSGAAVSTAQRSRAGPGVAAGTAPFSYLDRHAFFLAHLPLLA